MTRTNYTPIAEGSQATPGLWNAIFSALSTDLDVVLSTTTSTFSSSVTVTGGVTLLGPLSVQSGPIRITTNSNVSDYLYFTDSSNARSNYIIGSFNTKTADGLNIWDDSGQTMLASFSKQSIRFFQSVVGPVFDVGGALASTYNAATFGGSTTTVQIQAAISAASLAGVKRVYVPASMYPYDPTKISFDTRVQMVREGGNWATYDVIAYGAFGDGVTNDSIACQSALTFAPTGSVVFFPSVASRYRCSNLTVFRRLTITGVGRSSELFNNLGGPTLLIKRHPTDSSLWNSELQLDGVVVSGLYFSGDRSVTAKGLDLQRVDHCYFQNLTFEAIKGPGLHLSTEVRECIFTDITMRWCGSSATNAALLINDDTAGGGEGSNTIKFLGLLCSLNHGSAILVDTTNASYQGNIGSRTRYIDFIGFHVEGPLLNASTDFSGVTFPDADLQNPLIVLNDCQDIGFAGGASLSAGQGMSHISVSGSGNTGAYRIRLTDISVAGHTALSTGTVTTNNDGIRIAGNASEVFIQGVTLPVEGRDIVVPSTGSIHIGLNCQLSGNSESIATKAYLPANYLSGYFIPWFNQPLHIVGASTLSTIDHYASTVTATTRGVFGADPGGSDVLRVGGNVNIGASNAYRMGGVNILYGDGLDTFLQFPGAGGSIYFRNSAFGNAMLMSATDLSPGVASGMTLGSVAAWSALFVGDGAAIAPRVAFGSENSLGLYRSATSTVALSYGTVDLTGSGAVTSIASLKIKAGTNNSCGTAILGSNGSVNVANTYVKTGDLIFLTDQTPGGTIGDLEVGGIRNSSGFTIQSTSVTDTSTVAWLIVRPG